MKLRNNENKITIIIVASILILVGSLAFAFKTPSLNPRLAEEKYSILQTWEMPKELNEISGIDWIGNGKLACVQDEQGIIFIYNLNENKIEETVNFAEGGDYEGIAVVDSTAYVLRSDGALFEIRNYLKQDFEVIVHETPFSEKNDMESLTYDKENNRLLLIPKEKDLENEDLMGVYAFNLKNKKLDSNPIYKIDFNDPIFKNNKEDKGKKPSNAIHPADIAINPVNGNHYVVEGKKPKILILDKAGKAIKLTNLSKKKFSQPEGMVFSPEGRMYISNEGKKGTANILEVKLDE